MTEYVDYMQDFVFRIQPYFSGAGGKERDEKFVCHLIGAMPDSWEMFVAGLKSHPPDMLTPEYLIQKLNSEYKRRQDTTLHRTLHGCGCDCK